MANYAGQASAIYDPQQASEAASLTSGRDAAKSDLTAEAATIDPYYNDAVKGAQKVRQQEGYRQDYNSVLSNGGSTSGLLANEQAILGNELGDNVTKIENERAGKKADIGRRSTLLDNDYSSSMNALVQKYAGLKSSFIADNENNDRNTAASQAFDLQKMREQNSFTAGQNALDRAASAAKNVNPIDEFRSYISDQFKANGGAGNAKISRQDQDKWANLWFAQKGITNNADRQAYWDTFNTDYHRSGDPTKDPRYKR